MSSKGCYPFKGPVTVLAHTQLGILQMCAVGGLHLQRAWPPCGATQKEVIWQSTSHTLSVPRCEMRRGPHFCWRSGHNYRELEFVTLYEHRHLVSSLFIHINTFHVIFVA